MPARGALHAEAGLVTNVVRVSVEDAIGTINLLGQDETGDFVRSGLLAEANGCVRVFFDPSRVKACGAPDAKDKVGDRL